MILAGLSITPLANKLIKRVTERTLLVQVILFILFSLGPNIFMPLVFIGIFAYIFYLVARSLHQEVKMIYFLIFVPLICVISSLPSIGGLGVRDAGSAYLFAKVGVEAATAVSISLINFLFMIITGLVGGVIYVTALSSRRVQHCQTESPISPQDT